MDGPRRYILLLENDLNRVYNQSLTTVAATELQWASDGLLDPKDKLTAIHPVPFGRAAALGFTTTADEATLTPIIGQLSCALALFAPPTPDTTTPDTTTSDTTTPDTTTSTNSAGQKSADASRALTPIPLHESLSYGTELATTQRYRGKTNERLTRAMLNMALASAGIPLSGPWPTTPTVLDPMCGRGTTLNWALAYGLNAIGIELDAASLKHYETFLVTWAKNHRLPHKRQSFRSNNTEQRLFSLDVAADRKEQKAGRGQRIETFAADGGDTSLPIKRRSVDVIVSDLPYGIQHRSDSAKLDGADSADLVADLAPAWKRWLRPGGAVSLAWNLKRTPRIDVAVALAEGGLTVVDGPSMEHTVDATINRDVIIAVNTAGPSTR